ncbi:MULTISPECIES: hypothetical protein [Polynucleobacter]|uniref:hypothetical protein n=1 Tax=Polynucleobacter TaxID=44013 RepID=UPI0011A65676|nr:MULTISPECIES: hypothetical protein [Polynucleobacter]MBU3551698.1 hypothetical protein [Polynucleobacter sp. MWH-Post4-6-1]MBU3611073.1 hypothetical protein [Polynucleobacter wuianus]
MNYTNGGTRSIFSSFPAFNVNENNYFLTVTSSPVGAPEIDGSLAPKVGFLLGCLFLMFGRKKSNSETALMV